MIVHRVHDFIRYISYRATSTACTRRILRLQVSCFHSISQYEDQYQCHQQCRRHPNRCPTTQTKRFLPTSISIPQPQKNEENDTVVTSLRQVYPHLQHRFDSMTNEDGQYPISIITNNNKKKKIKMTDFQVDHDESNMVTTCTNRAAVMIMICMVENQPSILFTQRSSGLNTHAAQISFPGGKYDPLYDTNNIDIAFRETYEELLPRSCTSYDEFRSVEQFTIIGTATPVPSLYGKPVIPVLCLYWKEFQQHSDVMFEFPGNPDEVDNVFTVPIRDLYYNESTYPIPQSDKKINNKSNQRFGLTHTPMYPSSFGPIWGLTAFILQPFLHELFVPIFLMIENNKDE